MSYEGTRCSALGTGNEINEIGDLLTAMARKYLPQTCALDIKQIGLQPGENLHEKIMEEGLTSNEVEHFSIDEIMEII